MNKHGSARWIGWVSGVLSLTFCLALITAGQLTAEARLSAPWNHLLVLASLPLEYAGLVRWSAWAEAGAGQENVPPRTALEQTAEAIVLAGDCQPAEEEIQEAARLAWQSDRPLLLVEMVCPGHPGGWAEQIRPSLTRQGIRVRTQTVISEEPEQAMSQVLGKFHPSV